MFEMNNEVTLQRKSIAKEEEGEEKKNVRKVLGSHRNPNL